MSPDPIDRDRLGGDAPPQSNPINSERVSGSIDGLLTDTARRLLLDVLELSARYGFLGPGPAGHQLDHAVRMGLVIGSVIEPGRRLLDLGSGGGVPGLVVACQFPDSRITLMDSQERRCVFLEQASERLSKALGIHCDVEHGRAEILSRRPDLSGAFQTVVARSFGPPPVVAECASRFIAEAGYLVVAEPPESDGSRWDPDGLAKLGLELRSAVTSPVAITITQRTGSLDDRFPRRDGVPRRKPLW